jgi:predicted ATP-dependent serine protease
MFDKQINMILGDRATGKTTFLWEVSKALKLLNYKICFLGCTNEIAQDVVFLSHFDFSRILDTKVGADNYYMIESFKEFVEREKYDFMFIDDLDWIVHGYAFGDRQISKLQKSILGVNICKFVTCTELPKVKEKYSLYTIRNRYDDGSIMESATIEHNTDTYTQRGFINFLLRDLKIDDILK